jgi:hypothetical protein
MLVVDSAVLWHDSMVIMGILRDRGIRSCTISTHGHRNCFIDGLAPIGRQQGCLMLKWW